MKFCSTSNTCLQRCLYLLPQNQRPHFLLNEHCQLPALSFRIDLEYTPSHIYMDSSWVSQLASLGDGELSHFSGLYGRKIKLGFWGIKNSETNINKKKMVLIVSHFWSPILTTFCQSVFVSIFPKKISIFQLGAGKISNFLGTFCIGAT